MRATMVAWMSVVVAIACSGRIEAQTDCAGDLDADGDVDLRDYAGFSACLSGPGGAGCACFDFDGDVDIDLADFALFSQGFTGPLSEPVDCPSGQTNCDGTCVGTVGDPANCGACGNACGTGRVCQNGSCVVPPQCYGGQMWCSGFCREVALDPSNCGGCGIQCGPGENCAGGLCQSAEPCEGCGG